MLPTAALRWTATAATFVAFFGSDLNHPKWEYPLFARESDLDHPSWEYPRRALCCRLPLGMAVLPDVCDVCARSRHERGRCPLTFPLRIDSVVTHRGCLCGHGWR